MKRKVLKKQYRTLCKMLLGGAAVVGGMFANQHIAQAMPVINPADVRNNVNYDEIARTVTGDVANGFLSWKDFSINKDELLTFSGMTNMLNYVDASLFKNPSLIYGSIDASAVPGNFYIVNPNGVLFGPNSSVVANDFYVSTRSLSSDDIDNYINNGNKADFDLFSEIAHINENGLKSSDIMGTYDIADGDVMFLGQVQANSLTIEGNTIQIRNTADVKKLTKPDEETTYEWNDAPILQGDEVKLFSYNPPEVGYEVTTDNLTDEQRKDDVVNNLEYKYFVADALGDENMPNSANKLGWNAYAFENGIQTIDDYRLITSVEDLNLVNRSNSNKTEEAETTVTTSGDSYTIPYNAVLDGYVRGKYMLGNDIDFTTDEYKDKLFTPLGYKMDYRDFENPSDLITFNGLNFKINGLKTDTSVTDAQGELAAQGLFSVFAGTIKNVRITNVNIDASSNSDSAVGGLIGGIVSPANENFKTTIKNVSVNGTGITGTYAGGLVGNTKYGPSQKVEKVVVSEDYPDAQSDDYGYYILVAVAGAGSPIVTFENIENFAPVTSTSYKSYAGGIAGYVNGKNVSIINSMNQGAISSRSYAGGIFGYTHVYFDELNQNYEYATVNLDKVANMASVTSNMYSGGLLGFSHYDVGIYNSYNSGDIGSTSGNYNTSYAGGLAYYQLRTVENSFNTGKINALRGAAGLLAGNDSDSYVTTVKNSYNSGSVTASGENYGSAYGIAYKINSTASNIYNSGEITSTAKEYSDVAGIAYQLNGNVKNVYNVGNITNESNSGYTAGISYLAYGNLKNVYNFGNITSSSTYIKGDSYVGGYYSKYGNTAGIVNVFSRYDATADNIFNFGTVKATKGFASGIFNKIYRANDNLTNIYNVGNVTGLSAVGIVNSVNYSTNFENVYNFGTITATGTEVEPDSNDLTYSAGDYASGILGNISEEINLKNVYNFGEIDSKNFGAGIVDNLGGSRTVTFENVYNFAKVTAPKGAAGILRAQNKYYDEREEEYYSPSAVFNNVYNYGDITSANGLSAGIFGINLTEGESTFTDVYNLGTIKGTSAAGILNSSAGKITVNSAYNFGDVTATSTTGNAAGIIADVDAEAIANAVISSVYNEGKITGTNSYNIAPANVTGYTELESAEKPDTSIELDENVFDTTSKSSYSPSDTTNPEIDKAKVMNTLWTAFENIDMGGTNSELDSELVWRLYANPDNVTDKARQPLLSAFMQNVTVQRYNELDEAGKITPSSLVAVNESNVHKVHDSNGNVLYTRYKNSGQSVNGDIDEVDSSLVKSTVIDPSNATNFEIGNNNSFAEALIYSSQFGYNFQFDENSNDTWKESNDDKVSAAGTSPDDNAIYLKTAVVIEPTIINLSITAEKGEYKDNKFTVLANDEGKYYTVTSENTSDDLTTFLNILTSVVEVVDKDDEHKNTTLYIDTDKYTLSNPVTTTVDGETKTSYTITNKKDSTETYAIEKNSDGTFTYTDKANNTVYNITLTDGLITTYSDKDAEIKLASGTIENEELTLDKKVDGKDYTISGDDTIIGLLTDVLKVDANSEGTATALEFNNKVTTNNKVENADGTVTYNVTKGGKEYEFTKNTDGSYTYIDDKTNPLNIVTYTVTVDPGTLTYDVQIKVGNMTMEDDEVKSGGGYTVSSDNKGFIADLLSGKVSVIETDDGLNTTLQATNPSALTHSGNNYTYTATDGKTYNFTKDGNIYTYTADNGAIYEVTLEQGDVTKTYNIGITVSDGVYYISPNGEGTLSLDTDEGYTIEQSVGKDKFTNAFNVKYNDPADVTQITGPATTTVSVTNKTTGNNYKTSDVSATNGVYNSLTKNGNGIYTISAVNGNITYNINIKTGLVVSDTTIPVTINVKDGKITDDQFTNDGYTVTNNDILKLLDGKLEVVNVDGKTTVQFTDEVKNNLTDNGNGSYTYNDGTNKYDFTKNPDGTFTYEVENSNGETLTYNVAIQTGDLAIENNTDVKVTVNDGKITDGANFTSNGYDVDNDFIKGLLNGNLKVIKTDDKTTVTVNNADNLTKNGNNFTYTAANGTKYDFTKTGDNQYSYTVTSGNTTTNYHVTVIPGNINSTDHIPVTISVADGKINNGALTVVSDGGKDYTIDNENISNLLTDVLKVKTNSNGTATTLEFTDGVTVTGTTTNSNGSITYNVTKNGTPYTFTKNSDGTFTYTDNSDSSNVLIYNVTVDPGTLTYGVTVKAGDMTKTDNVITSGGDYTVTGDNKITDSNGVIAELLSGKLEVVETDGGQRTTLAAKDINALTVNGNNYTYTADGKVYNFTKSGDVYTYTADNGVIYEVTLEKGNLNKIYNIGIQVSDGVYYINEQGDGTLSLDVANGYTITNDPDNSNFTDNFSVKYNDPADVTKITGPATTTVSVTNKATNNNYNTSDISATNGVYNSLTKNDDGSYTIQAVKDNVTYNINIKTGLVVSDTTIPVTINVENGKLTDGAFTSNGYDVTNNDIKTLLQDALEVINVDGKTTVKFKDEISAQTTTNADGTVTYNVTKGTTPYTFTKNTDGTFTYSVTNPNGEEINYHVTINNGDVLNENNTNVVVTVNNGTMTDGEFTGNGYDVDNDFIKGLLNGNLQVINRNDKATVTVRNNSNLVQNGNSYTYTTPSGTPYTFTKTGDNQYSYTVTSGNTTTHYNVTVVPGSINSTNHVPVTISVGDGKINNGALTVVKDGGKDYTIDNENISNLLTDVLTVDTNSDGTATTLKFTDDVKVVRLIRNSDGSITYNVTKGTTPYTFTKNSDGTFTYTDNSDASNVLVYNVTVDPGTLTYGVTVKAGDITQTDNVETSNGGYTVTNDNTITNSNGVIAELLNGKLEVVPTTDGLNTTLAATDANALKRNGNNYTYTADDGKIYNFTKSGNVYTYTADNGAIYEVTLEQGDVEKIYNIGIQVTDGVFYINENGVGNLSLDKAEGYTITRNAENSNFTDNFNISYNEPLKNPGDTTQVTGPYKTTVTIKNKDGNSYNTNDFDIISGGYNNINANKDGSYTISAVKDNVTYNINIKPGSIVSDTRIPVTINVKDGKVVDDNFTGNGYDVTNADIKTLLDGKLEVVNVDGKTTVKFKDEVSTFITNNGDGTYTYDDGTNKYTYNKNTDGTFTYSVTNTKGEEINYNVTIDMGDITTTNSVPVTISVGDGTITDDKFTGGGYTITDPTSRLKNLLGDLTVTPTSDGNHTTITLPTGELLVLNDDGTYTYTYTGEDGNITKYIITIDPGDISKYKNENVTVTVGNGRTDNGTFTPEGYTVPNDTIRNLLDGVITVTTTDNATTKLDFVDKSEGVFTDNGDGTFIYNKGGVNYPFTKTGDNTYTFSMTGDDGLTTNYNITIQPGTVTNYLDENVSVKVGNGFLNDGEFNGNGYDVDNDLIGGLLSGELNVNYNRRNMSTNVEFANPENLTTDGTNYRYTKGGVTYNFTKNSDGTFNYVVTNGNTITTYKVTVDPGTLTIHNTPRETSTPSNTTSTPSNNTSTPSTPTNNNSSGGNTSTPTTPTNNNSSSSGGGSSSTPTTPTNSVPTPIYTTSTPAQNTTTTPAQYTTTPSTNEPTNDISITSTPEPTITTPTVDINSEPEPIEEIISTPETTPLDEIISTPEPTVTTPTDEIISTPESAPTDEVISTPETAPTDETISTPESAPTDEIISTTENIAEVDLNEPDVDLRSSQMEEFPEEKGDYIDLDAQDHLLIETVDANESILDIDVVPEEFNEATARNIVDSGNVGLTSIAESPTTVDTGNNANISTNTSTGNGDGLTSINATPSNSAPSNAPSSTTSTGGNQTGGLNSISSNSNSNRNSNSRSTTANENSTGNLTTVNESQGDTLSAGDNDSSSTAVNMDGDLGAIEAGRSDSSQEVSTDGNGQGTQELSAGSQNTQDSNSDNQTSQDTNSNSNSNSDNSSDNENDDDNDNDSGEE